MKKNLIFKDLKKYYLSTLHIDCQFKPFLSKWARINKTILRNVKLIKLASSERL
jgi:hypothetical protein